MAAATASQALIEKRGLVRSDGGVIANSLHRSRFLGSRRSIRVPPASAGGKQAGEVARESRFKTVRSASFFERLGKAFFPSAEEEEQVFSVYEINELDRSSPAYLRLTPHTSSTAPIIGDLVPYSNKVYGPCGKAYLGVSAGLCVVIEHHFPSGGDRYETTYTHYIGDYGQMSAMGPYYTYEDSEMVVTGGTGIFKGARGIVKVHNVNAPLQLLYTYHVTGIPKLPDDLCRQVVPLAEVVAVTENGQVRVNSS